MGLMKILDHFGIGLDDIINGLISFKDFIFELPGKIADGFKSIFNKIQNFFIDAINGVIESNKQNSRYRDRKIREEDHYQAKTQICQSRDDCT